MRIVTYNVLAPKLCNPKWFTHSRLEAVDPTNRLKAISIQLEHEMKQQSVICLQEVSRDWASAFHVLFSQGKYHFIHCSTQGKSSDYMGPALAFPLEKYELLTTAMPRVSDALQAQLNPFHRGRQWLAQWFCFLWAFVSALFPCVKWIHTIVAFDIWEKARTQ